MTDYWLNKLFFDLQRPDLAARFKSDRDSVLAAYPMPAALRAAVVAPCLTSAVTRILGAVERARIRVGSATAAGSLLACTAGQEEQEEQRGARAHATESRGHRRA